MSGPIGQLCGGNARIVAMAAIAFALSIAVIRLFTGHSGWIVAAVSLFFATLALMNSRYWKGLARRGPGQQTLPDSELQFRYAFEEASVGMVILNAAGQIHSVNRGFCDITLYSTEEILGKT